MLTYGCGFHDRVSFKLHIQCHVFTFREVHANKVPNEAERKTHLDKVLGTKKDKRDVNTVSSRAFMRMGAISPKDNRMFKIFNF